MIGTVVTLQECLQSSGLILKELRASLLAGLRRPGTQGMPSPVNECYHLFYINYSPPLQLASCLSAGANCLRLVR